MTAGVLYDGRVLLNWDNCKVMRVFYDCFKLGYVNLPLWLTSSKLYDYMPEGATYAKTVGVVCVTWKNRRKH